MYYLIYKTTHINGKFYVGRHVTSDIEDNYFGSGKWIRSIKDKTKLRKEILYLVSSFEELLELEQKVISEFINDPLNMNFSNSSIGFSYGNRNPNCSEEARNRNRNRMLNDNPMKGKEHTSDTKQKISDSLKGRFISEETRKKISNSNSKKRGPISEEGRKSLKEHRKKAYENGTINPPSFLGKSHNKDTKSIMSKKALERKTEICPHCKGEFKVNVINRWHNDNCKERDAVGL